MNYCRAEYDAYKHAKDRCNNPRNPKYFNYGGRGIKFLFPSFKKFLAHLKLKPSSAHSLDRIDNNGNYEPGNVRWATSVQQNRNMRRNYAPTANDLLVLYAETKIKADTV